MDKISSIRDVINLWPRRADCAADVQRIDPRLRVTTAMVHKWAELGSIRPIYHWALIEAGRARGFPISADLLVRLHAPGRGGTHVGEDAA